MIEELLLLGIGFCAGGGTAFLVARKLLHDALVSAHEKQGEKQ